MFSSSNLYVVIDCSGSMLESGKHLIVRGVVREIEQYFRLGYAQSTVRIVHACEKSTVIEWNTDTEFPEMLFECKGVFNASFLVSLLDSYAMAKFLILSDGNWSSKDYRVFEQFTKSIPNNTVRFIKIGAEPESRRLKNFSFFSAEEVFSVLDGWLEEKSEW